MTYTVGKISITKGEDIVRGTSTRFVDTANIKLGDLFYFRTNDKDTILLVVDVIDNNSLRLSHLDASPFNPQQNSSQIAYGIIQDFGEGLTAKLSSQLALLQRKWHQRENELTGWFTSDKASHDITSFNGEIAQIPTPAGIKTLAQTAHKTSEYLTQFEQDIQRNTASLAQVSPKLDEFDSQAERMDFMHQDIHQKHNDVVDKHNEFKAAAGKIDAQAHQVHTLSAQVADDTLHADIARKAADAQASISALMTTEVTDAKQRVDTQLAHSIDVAKSVESDSAKAQTAQAFTQALADKVTVQYNEVEQLKEAFSADTLQVNIAKKAVDAQAAAASMQAVNSEKAAEQANQLKQQTELFKDQAGQISTQVHRASQQAQTAASNADGFEKSATYQAGLASQASVLAHEQANKAEQAANLASKVTTDFTAATIPEVGKVPVALNDAQIDEHWVNLEQGMSRLALGILSNNLNRYQKDQLIESLSAQVDDLRDKLQVTQVELEKVANTPVTDINKDYFQGTHASGGTHELPVFNMVERGWLSTASYQEGMAEFLRMNGGSGVVGTRQYQADKGFSVGHRVVDASYATLNIHNHPNYKAMPGMAEVAACINGYYFRTRHNDYRLMHSVPGQYLARSHSIAAQIPSYVNALPTGCEADGRINFQNTQAGYMRDVKQQSPEDCIWELSYLECWIETFQDDLNDPTDSFRHSNDGKKLKEIFDKGRYLNYSGHKNRSENLPYHPMRISYVDDQGVPQHGLLQFRISSMPVATLAKRLGLSNAKVIVGNTGSHYHHIAEPLSQEQIEQLKTGEVPALTVQTSTDFNHRHDIRITWKNGQLVGEDLDTSHQHPVSVIYGDSSQLPYDEDKALKGIIDHTNRFKLVKDLRSRARVGNNQRLMRSRMARFECVDLAQLCEQLPGLEGVGASLQETYDQYGLNDILQDWQGGELNAAYYNRRYRFSRNDASGRVTANRGFNDPTLFCAKTTHAKVVGGFSWMIPLELILRTPREHWNPYECAYVPNAQLRTEEDNEGGKNAETAFSGIDDRHFYFGTPKALLTEQVTGNDPADTANTAWVKGKDGTPRLLYGNGIRVHDYDGHRQRFPVYPLYFEHSHDANQQHWLRDNLKTLLKQAVSGTLTINDIDEML
ncbi:hypothetical protein PCIT_a2995 [Pseudoalteromonas citrea]|uniref:Uncharacterized protein n=2 Tax=Pseudoalteromonas citrea TaxID=43655 RepID=A0AAD4AI32_9GAMM|nr:hypothetical protein [Pseudoalteromonas citrea]KAF7770046.1 hypothetical protein PCIT_a2995 [Pseudoalteromonas citrea]